ncbi:MAG: ROK family transcriptional regulator [Bryobacterales bacterium]|nr:ROK family transcriptional regulator [Bryobacterales bacterium]
MKDYRAAIRGAQRVTQIRGANRALVLQTLRKHSLISRAQLARRTGLSEGAVSRIAAELIEDRLIREQGAENSTGGRPGTRLELDPGYHRVIGVDIRQFETRVALGTLQGQVIETQRFRTPRTPTKALDMVAERINSQKVSAQGHLIHGVGVSVRGIVDHERGVVEVGSSASWNNIHVKEALETRSELPVFVENNVRAAALAQYNSDRTEINGSGFMLFIRVDEGIGMGIVIDGKLFRGAHRSAGEIGQMVVADAPGSGAQDRPGCLESLAAYPAIFARYNALSGERRGSSGETESRIRRICHLAQQGDAAAIQALRETMRFLGIGIANVIWGFNADVVIVDGAITDVWPLVADAIREQFPKGEEFRNFHNLLLRPCTLGLDASLIGALTIPFVDLFETGEASGLPSTAGQ